MEGVVVVSRRTRWRVLKSMADRIHETHPEVQILVARGVPMWEAVKRVPRKRMKGEPT